LFGVPIFMFSTLLASLGDCMPGVECHKGLWEAVLLPTIIVAAPIGLGIRWAVNRMFNNRS
jgi:hypothetical protein